MLIAALIGFAFGFIGSMPVAGPIAVLVFTRGIEARFASGLAIAVGAAVAEGTYAFLAFWGFSTFLAQYDFIVPLSRAGAAVILASLGVYFVRRRTTVPAEPPDERAGVAGQHSSAVLGFTITALNPTLIATWTAAVTTLFSTGLVAFAPSLAFPFALSAMVGIVVWFMVLLGLLRRVRGRFRPETLDRVVRVMGVFLVGLSLFFVVQFVRWLA